MTHKGKQRVLKPVLHMGLSKASFPDGLIIPEASIIPQPPGKQAKAADYIESKLSIIRMIKAYIYWALAISLQQLSGYFIQSSKSI